MRALVLAALFVAVAVPSAAEAKGRVRLRFGLPWSSSTPRAVVPARTPTPAILPAIALPLAPALPLSGPRPDDESDATGSTARLSEASVSPEAPPARKQPPCPENRRVGAFGGFCTLN